MDKKPQDGFVLIELVTTLILIGVIGAFAGLFLYTGVNGFIASKRNSETALAAQIALDRISAELRYVSSLPIAPGADSITYLSKDLPGTRRLRYDSGLRTIYLSVNGVENPLLDNVATFTLNLNHPETPAANMDNADGDEEIAAIVVGFTIVDVGTQFNVRIHPRVFIPRPS
jgi:prepilin-type N-terminal cleavage/methylation domain-containing protein